MPLLACGWSQNYRGEGRGEKERGGEERGGEEKGGEERGGGGKGGGKGAERRREEREGVMPFKTISMHTPMSEISFFFFGFACPLEKHRTFGRPTLSPMM